MRWPVLVVAAGCAAHVSQDRATGADGRIEGAQRMTWATETRAEAHGTVTYPGGDRVDWWFVRLPDTLADVEIELRWKSPRPRLSLTFDVFGDDHRRIAGAARGVDKSYARLSLGKVAGEHYIRVYARDRGDAGTYALAVMRTAPPAPPEDFDWHAVEIPMPPDLPDVPEPVFVCSAETFDPKRVECAKICPPGRPEWPGCEDKPCPTPPDAKNRRCWATMPCPTPPDPRIRACAEPRIAPPPAGRVVGLETRGGETIVTVGVGSDTGIDVKWRATVVRSQDGAPVPGGEGTILRVDKHLTVVRVRLTLDQVKQAPWVRFAPSP
jgi:hypothetical protein